MTEYPTRHLTGDHLTLMHAVSWAANQHKTQTRAGGRQSYIVHPLRVAKILADNGEDLVTVIAAVLHDVVEDCGRTADDKAMLEAFIQVTWPESFALVGLMTKRPGLSKEAYYAAICSNQKAVNLKLTDRADNLNDMYDMIRSNPREKGNVRWAEKYLQKTVLEIDPISHLGNVFYSRLYADAKTQLSALLESPDLGELANV